MVLMDLPALSVCVAVDNLCGKKHDSKCFINAGGLRESAVRKGVLKNNLKTCPCGFPQCPVCNNNLCCRLF